MVEKGCGWLRKKLGGRKQALYAVSGSRRVVDGCWLSSRPWDAGIDWALVILFMVVVGDLDVSCVIWGS